MNHCMDTQAEEIFAQALELDPADRQGFVDDACAGNGDLHRQVQQLLMDAAAADAYFTQDLGGASWAEPSVNILIEKGGDRIGPYKLLQSIGEGGFGMVWMAEQDKPISRRVAVKVVKAGMDTKEVLARFDAERQALARMDHPNIARVFDAGVTPTGRPYFAMELVKGIPITRFCDDQQLGANERLVLFADVCAAINHAHQKGVIHRDIKPSNVLVTLDGDSPLVKVIDFGISKAIEGKLTDGTFFTRIEQWVGTPVYMSPEQAGLGSLDIDTRSDIYALGVMLYELLTGVPPFDQATLIEAGYEEMRRIIREVEPERPSQRLTSLNAGQAAPIAAARRVPEGRLRRLIPCDLDWIVMKAIDKSRDRRYETAAALAEDIARFLADQPVTAKPPGASYLFRKFAKRHRTGFRVACGFAILLMATAVFSSWLALRATKAEALAGQRLTEAVAERNAKDRALQDAHAVSRLLTEVFKRPNPEMDGRKVTVVEALDAATEKLNADLAGQPERLAMLQEVMAATYEGLALYDKSLVLRKMVLEIRRCHPGVEHPDCLRSLHSLVKTYERLGLNIEARNLADEEVNLLCRHHQDNGDQSILAALKSFATNCFLTGERDKAITAQKELLDRCRAIYGAENQETRKVEWQLTQYRRQSGQVPKVAPVPNTTGESGASDTAVKAPPSAGNTLDAEQKRTIDELEKQLARATREFGPAHLKTLDIQRELAETNFACSHWEDAVRVQTQALALAREEYGPLNEVTLLFYNRLATMCYQAGKKDDAIRVLEELVPLNREKYGEKHPATLDSEEALLEYERRGARWDKYDKFLPDLIERSKKAYGLEHPTTLYLQDALALRLFCSRKTPEALALAGEVVPLLRKVLGSEDRRTLNAISNLARCYAATGRTREAVDLLTECCPRMRDDTFVNLMLASLQLWLGLDSEYHQTRIWMMDFAKTRQDGYKSRHDILQRGILISCLAPLENDDQAHALLATLERADVIQSSPDAPLDYGPGSAWRTVIAGIAYYRVGDHAQAAARFDTVLRLAADNTREDLTWERGMASYYKAMTLFRTGDKEAARTLFEATASKMKHWSTDEHPLTNNFDPSGAPVCIWLAYKESKALIDHANPADKQ